MTPREIQIIVKEAARKAGIKEWKHVTPKCLRKTYEHVLRSERVDGTRLDYKTQEFLMGHTLPGSQDTYYDKTKIDELREEYSKLNFNPNNPETIIAKLLKTDSIQLPNLKEGSLLQKLLEILQNAKQEEAKRLQDVTGGAARILTNIQTPEKATNNRSQSKNRQTTLLTHIKNENVRTEINSRILNEPPLNGQKQTKQKLLTNSLSATVGDAQRTFANRINMKSRVKPKEEAKLDIFFIKNPKS